MRPCAPPFLFLQEETATCFFCLAWPVTSSYLPTPPLLPALKQLSHHAYSEGRRHDTLGTGSTHAACSSLPTLTPQFSERPTGWRQDGHLPATHRPQAPPDRPKYNAINVYFTHLPATRGSTWWHGCFGNSENRETFSLLPPTEQADTATPACLVTCMCL